MERYRKRPIVIEARQLSSAPGKHGAQIAEWAEIESLGPAITPIGNNVNGKFECICISIQTLEGRMTALPGDWIIRGIKGELYSCKPDVFAETYEPADVTRPLAMTPDPDAIERREREARHFAIATHDDPIIALNAALSLSPSAAAQRVRAIIEEARAIDRNEPGRYSDLHEALAALDHPEAGKDAT